MPAIAAGALIIYILCSLAVRAELNRYDKKHQQAIEQCTTQAEWTPVKEVRI